MLVASLAFAQRSLNQTHCLRLSRELSGKSGRHWSLGILSIVRVKRVHRVDDLGKIIFCLCALGLILHSAKSGKEQTDQDRNDCDNDQQFDESKAIVGNFA